MLIILNNNNNILLIYTSHMRSIQKEFHIFLITQPLHIFLLKTHTAPLSYTLIVFLYFYQTLWCATIYDKRFT